MDVDGAESLTVLVGLVNGIDAVNESDAQLPECSENSALGLFSADGRKCSGNADAGSRQVIATTVIATIARNITLFVVVSGSTAVITSITVANNNNNTMEALKCGTRAREIILGIRIIKRRGIREV